MRKSTGILLSIISLMVGVVLGFMSAPIKKGINIECGNNCGNYKADDNAPKECEECEEIEELEDDIKF